MSLRPETTRPRHSWLSDVLLVTFGAALLYGIMLGTRELGVPDEARYSEIPREMVASGHYITPRLDGVLYFEKPPLFYWLQTASIHLMGLSQWSMRFWTAFFAVLGCVAVYATGRALYNRRTGLLSAMVLGTSLLYFGMGHIVTLDMTVSVLLSLSLFAFMLAEREPPGLRRRLGMWAAFLWAALATLTKGLIGIVFPMMAIGLWIIALWDWSILKRMYLPTGFALFLLVAAPWHILMQLRHPTFLHYYFVRQHFERYLTHVAHRYQPFWYFLPILLAGVLPWTAFIVQAARFNLSFAWRDRRRHAETLLLVIWVASIFAFFSASDSKLVPYILPVFPPLAILIGRYLDARWDQALGRGDRWAFRMVAPAGLALGAAAAFVVPATRPSLEPHTMALAMGLLGATLAITAVAASWAGLTRGLRAGAVALALGFSVFLLGVNASATYLDTRTVKTLILTLRPRLTPSAIVACYGWYYQDVPFYLRRRVEVVDYKGELGYGTTLEKTPWIMRGPAFWRQWDSNRPVYMVTSRPTYERLRQRGIDMRMVAGNAFNVVVGNKAS
ncbi:phospholipid carrier-dependent glycosyltransferase [Acidiferrobacter sp.]|uniref:glycosyltransferase family 39 protein n=1 Tax=Acidiferrobacter sp. TaxID=1872107 RepID=UPI0026124F64|nr:phospholipid carrier-dependent glycosyltransferase [Acidiferrobacter sp.]